jgi:hypothetical protein
MGIGHKWVVVEAVTRYLVINFLDKLLSELATSSADSSQFYRNIKIILMPLFNA